MSERIDHAAEAWEVWRDGIARGHPDAMDNPTHESLLHMVNALVEQQRVANMIALARPEVIDEAHDAKVWVSSWDVERDGDGLISRVTLRPDIAAALGVEEDEA